MNGGKILFNIFKKTRQFDLVAPTDGKLIPITTVSDSVFSQEVLGVGYAFKPNEDNFYAPISGVIESIFPTKHAVSLINDLGVEVLIHLGINTVELNGAPFDMSIKIGQKVRAGEFLGKMDCRQVKTAGKDDTIIVVFTNKNQVSQFPERSEQMYHHGDIVGQVTL